MSAIREFAIASHANVARVMKRFEREELTAKDGRKLVLTARFFDDRSNTHVKHVLRGDLLRRPRRVAATSSFAPSS